MIDFTNWYWTIGGDLGRAYSSARNIMVDAGDAAFAAWQRAGGVPSRVADQAELWGVLSRAAPDHLPSWLFDGEAFVQPAAGAYRQAQLMAYTAAVRYGVETGGIDVQSMPIPTDRASQAMIAGAFNYAQVDPQSVTNFKTASGFVALSAAQITALARAVGAHVQACFTKEAEVGAAIASGSVDTLAAIDAAFQGV